MTPFSLKRYSEKKNSDIAAQQEIIVVSICTISGLCLGARPYIRPYMNLNVNDFPSLQEILRYLLNISHVENAL